MGTPAFWDVEGVGMAARRVITSFVLLSSLAGCTTLPKGVTGPAPVATALAPTSRQLQWPDLSTLSPVAPTSTYTETSQASYLNLTAEECRVRACREASLAELLQRSAVVRDPGHQSQSQQDLDRLRQRTADHLGREIRNRTAGAALDLYYQLLEAELLLEVLDASLTEVGAVIALAQKAIKEGAKQPPDLDQLRKQQVDLRSDMAKLQAGIRRLNAELKGLLKQDHTPGNLLPADTIQIPNEPLETDGLVTVGLNQRPDLHVLRELIAGLNPHTVAPIRDALVQLVPPMAALQALRKILLPGLQLLLNSHRDGEVEPLRRQLIHALRQREDDATRDIRSSASEWESQRQIVAIAKQRVDLEAQRIRELEVLKKAGRPVELDWRCAKLERLKAEAELVRESIKWKRADVKTRQEMGILCPCQE